MSFGLTSHFSLRICYNMGLCSFENVGVVSKVIEFHCGEIENVVILEPVMRDTASACFNSTVFWHPELLLNKCQDQFFLRASVGNRKRQLASMLYIYLFLNGAVLKCGCYFKICSCQTQVLLWFISSCMQYIIDGILLFLAFEPMMGDRSLSLPNQFENPAPFRVYRCFHLWLNAFWPMTHGTHYFISRFPSRSTWGSLWCYVSLSLLLCLTFCVGLSVSLCLSLFPWPVWSVIEVAVFTWPTGIQGTLCALWRQIALFAPQSLYLSFTFLLPLVIHYPYSLNFICRPSRLPLPSFLPPRAVLLDRSILWSPSTGSHYALSRILQCTCASLF